MNNQQPSFSVKPSHKILNNEPVDNLPEESHTEQSMENTKNNTQQQSNSNTGMVVHTTNTSVEDFY